MPRSLVEHGAGKHERTAVRTVDLSTPVIREAAVATAKTSGNENRATRQQCCSVKGTSDAHVTGRPESGAGYVQFAGVISNRFAVGWVPAAGKQERTVCKQSTGEVLQ